MIALIFGSPARAADIYVAPGGGDTARGSRDDPCSLSAANANAQAGDNVILLSGNYATVIAPAHDGREGASITFKAADPGGAAFDGGPLQDQEAIQLSGRAYIVIDGFTVKHVRRFIMAEGPATHDISIDHCRFEQFVGKSFESCRFRNVGDSIRVTHCYMTGGNDLLAITGGNHHLVEDNFFGEATHADLVLVMVQQMVVRGNRFTNHQWKMMEVFNTRQTPEPHRLSEYNLIENNLFDTTVDSGIQYAGSRMIVRRNLFNRCRFGMSWANYRGSAKTPEAWYDQSNRFYNNVLYACGPSPANLKALAESGIKPAEEDKGAGVAMEFATNMEPPAHFGDQVCVNNIFCGNVGAKSPMAPTVQISFTWDASPRFGNFFHNDIFSGTAGAPVFFWLDAGYEKPPVERNLSLKNFETIFPTLAAENIEADPQFVDAEKGDFHLKPASPCIDAGRPLTRVTAISDGLIVKVADALFFTSGYGIRGVAGDFVRIGRERVKVVAVDYGHNELTLDRAIQCKVGDAVSLDYLGSAPDLGAFECR